MSLFDSAGVQLYYEETGSGDPIIWIHEFCANHKTWEAQVRRFSRDYRCITYNARGYPPSEIPVDPAAYRYEHQRDDVVRLMNALRIEKAHLVGLSMGAYTGLQVALKYPERVRSLVFSSGGSSASPGGGSEKFKADAHRGAERMLREGMEAGANAMAMGPTRIQHLNKDPRGWEEFRRHMSENSAEGSALTLKNYQAERPSFYQYEAELRVLDVPVLLAAGDEDDHVIDTNLYLKRTLPRAGLWMHPRTGHGMNLEEPDEYNRRIADFLSAVERGGWRRRDSRADSSRSLFSGNEHRVGADRQR